MGYYTYYEMEVHKDISFPKEGSELDHDSAQQILRSSEEAINRNVDLVMLEETLKWYSFGRDMRAISKEMENYVFVLYGDGEETDDVWKAMFYRGKMIRVEQKSYFPSMNLSKLGLTDPDDCTPPEPKPIDEYFWNKDEK